MKKLYKLLGVFSLISLGIFAVPVQINALPVPLNSPGVSGGTAAARTAAENEKSSWNSATLALGQTQQFLGTFPTQLVSTQVNSNLTNVSFSGTTITANFSKRDISLADSLSNSPNTIGTQDVISFNDPAISNSATLQDNAPRPSSLYNTASQPNYFNMVGGDGSTLDSVYIDFSQPVKSFGIWAGDLETRTNGTGLPARIKLYDISGNVISNYVVTPGTADQTTCGGTTASALSECGNRQTMFLGFSDSDANVKSMQIIVGDDDSCAVFPSDCDGTAEHISLIGPTLALAPPELVVSKNDGVDEYTVGDSIVWTIDYENIGDMEDSGIVLTETLPDGVVFNAGLSSAGWVCDGQVCTLEVGSLAAGGSGSVMIGVDVPGGIDAGGITNSVSIVGKVDTVGDSDTDDDMIVLPDLVVSKNDGVDEYTVGDSIVWTIDYENIGDGDDSDVVLTETLPDGVVFNAGLSSAGWVCDGQVCTLEVGSLASGNSGSVMIGVDVPAGINAGGITNSVSIVGKVDTVGDSDTDDDIIYIEVATTTTTTTQPTTSTTIKTEVKGIVGTLPFTGVDVYKFTLLAIFCTMLGYSLKKMHKKS